MTTLETSTGQVPKLKKWNFKLKIGCNSGKLNKYGLKKWHSENIEKVANWDKIYRGKISKIFSLVNHPRKTITP